MRPVGLFGETVLMKIQRQKRTVLLTLFEGTQDASSTRHQRMLLCFEVFFVEPPPGNFLLPSSPEFLIRQLPRFIAKKGTKSADSYRIVQGFRTCKEP